MPHTGLTIVAAGNGIGGAPGTKACARTPRSQHRMKVLAKAIDVHIAKPSAAARSPRKAVTGAFWDAVDELAQMQCAGCEASFTLMNRRHHCRACLAACCDACCAGERMPVAGMVGLQRVCASCALVVHEGGASAAGATATAPSTPLLEGQALSATLHAASYGFTLESNGAAVDAATPGESGAAAPLPPVPAMAAVVVALATPAPQLEQQRAQKRREELSLSDMCRRAPAEVALESPSQRYDRHRRTRAARPTPATRVIATTAQAIAVSSAAEAEAEAAAPAVAADHLATALAVMACTPAAIKASRSNAALEALYSPSPVPRQRCISDAEFDALYRCVGSASAVMAAAAAEREERAAERARNARDAALMLFILAPAVATFAVRAATAIDIGM